MLMRLVSAMDRLERAAAAADEPIAIGFQWAERGMREVELRGGIDGTIDLDAALATEVPERFADAFGFEHLPRISSERVASSSISMYGSGYLDPLPWAVTRLSKEMKRFNVARPVLEIAVSERISSPDSSRLFCSGKTTRGSSQNSPTRASGSSSHAICT